MKFTNQKYREIIYMWVSGKGSCASVGVRLSSYARSICAELNHKEMMEFKNLLDSSLAELEKRMIMPSEDEDD